MKKLLDNTYIHAVARCIRGEASHMDDVTSFVRFIAELLVVDEMAFTSSTGGAVHGATIDAIRCIESEFPNPGLFRHHAVPGDMYITACIRASDDMAYDLSGGTLLRDDVGRTVPDFVENANNPDLDYMHSTMDVLGQKRNAPMIDIITPENAAHFVLTRPRVVSALGGAAWVNDLEGQVQYLKMAAAARASIYRHVGSQIGIGYVPASSRARLLEVSNGIGIVSELPASISNAASQFNLETVVRSLVHSASGDPVRILRAAWRAREAVRPLLGNLDLVAESDSIMAEFDSSQSSRDMEKYYRDVMSDVDYPQFIDALEIQLIFIGIPVLKIDGMKLRRWLGHRRAKKRFSKVMALGKGARELGPDYGGCGLGKRSGL